MKNKKNIISTTIIIAILLLFISGFIWGQCNSKKRAQKNLDEHFGDISLSEEESKELAKSIVDPDNKYNLGNDYEKSNSNTTSNEYDMNSNNSETLLDEQNIINDEDFINIVAERLTNLKVKDIKSFSVTIEESKDEDLNVTAHIETDICKLNLSMVKLSLTGTWICYSISNAENGHIYSPVEAKEYVDVYDYATDTLLYEKEGK